MSSQAEPVRYAVGLVSMSSIIECLLSGYEQLCIFEENFVEDEEPGRAFWHAIAEIEGALQFLDEVTFGKVSELQKSWPARASSSKTARSVGTHESRYRGQQHGSAAD